MILVRIGLPFGAYWSSKNNGFCNRSFLFCSAATLHPRARVCVLTLDISKDISSPTTKGIF